MTQFIILPGSGGSGASHWQTHWEQANPAMRRFQPSSWTDPDFQDWLNALDTAVALASEPPILVAHSLSCLVIAHWQKAAALPVKGAFLVAVPDPTAPIFPHGGTEFSEAFERPLRFPSVILASGDDPYGSLAYAQKKANEWGSELKTVGPLGHINGRSGLGGWPEGAKLLADFVQRIERPEDATPNPIEPVI